MQGRANPGSQQFHLLIPVAGSVLEAEQLGASEPGYCRMDDGHEVLEAVMEKNICRDDETAGIINEGNKVDPFLPFCRGKPGTVTGIPVPYLIDMGPFVPPHVLIGGIPFFFFEQTYKALHRRYGKLSRMDAAAGKKDAVDLSGRNARMRFFQMPDLHLKVQVQLPADTFITAALREQGIETALAVSAVPFFYCGSADGCEPSIWPGIRFFGSPAEKFVVADRGITGPGFERGDHAVAEKGDLLFLVHRHAGHRLSLTLSPHSGTSPKQRRK